MGALPENRNCNAGFGRSVSPATLRSYDLQKLRLGYLPPRLETKIAPGERPLQLLATRSIAILARYLSLEIIQEIMEDGNSSVK
jgi:hypothetical protein